MRHWREGHEGTHLGPEFFAIVLPLGVLRGVEGRGRDVDGDDSRLLIVGADGLGSVNEVVLDPQGDVVVQDAALLPSHHSDRTNRVTAASASAGEAEVREKEGGGEGAMVGQRGWEWHGSE